MNTKLIAQALRMLADGLEGEAPVTDAITEAPTPIPQSPQPAAQPQSNVVQHPTTEIKLPDVLMALRKVAQAKGQPAVTEYLQTVGITSLGNADQTQLRQLLGWAQQQQVA